MPRDLYQAGSAYHEARKRYAPSAVRCLALAMAQLDPPVSLLDVGCGEDAPLVAWAREGHVDAWGVDLAVPTMIEAGLITADLQHPFDCKRVFDWVLCWEVAEHLPAECAETLCDTLVRHVARPHGRLLFTAARPGQRGPGHVHCRPAEYWRQLLTDRGLAWLSRESTALAKAWRIGATDAQWYAANIQVFAWS